MEIWKVIPEFKKYEISSLGRVRKSKTGYIRKLAKNEDGYLKIILSRSTHDMKSLRIHRLVAQAFIPNPENKLVVNHINGKKSDNCVENLEWCTHKENSEHSIKLNLICKSLILRQVKKIKEEENFILIDELISYLEEMQDKKAKTVSISV